MRRTAVVLDAATTSTLAQRFRRWAVAGRVFGFDLEQLSLAQSPEGVEQASFAHLYSIPVVLTGRLEKKLVY